MSDIGNKPLGSDWTAFLPKQMMPVANLLVPQFEVAAAVSVASTEIATRMFGIWTSAMLGSFDLKAATGKQTEKPATAVDIADLKAVIRGKAVTFSEPARPIKRDVVAGSSAATDNLKKISGVGPKLEQVLNSMGIRSFAHIAGWTADDIANVDGQLKLNGRISRDDWVGQANRFVSEVK
jgi:NADH-quinone oxidoreductase subunit E